MRRPGAPAATRSPTPTPGPSGSVGPNLDHAKPSAALVVDLVTNGKGAMPSFSGQLSKGEIEALAAYVSQASGG